MFAIPFGTGKYPDEDMELVEYLKSMEEFYKSELKWICDLRPFEIHIVGDTAVLYTTYTNKFTDPEGNETTSSGPWTAVLIKQDGKWLLLSNSFT